MTNPDALRTYLDELRKKLATGMAKEHAYRGALERLLQATGDGVQAINDSAWIDCGAPDFIVLRGATPVGYVEAKDIDTSLDEAQRSAQLKRYRESLHNLILTDYLELRWYVEGEERDRARLATVSRDGKVKSTGAGIDAVRQLLERFFAQQAPMLGTARELAQRMASLAWMIRGLIQEAYQREGQEGRFHRQFAAFEETLIPGLTAEQFADMYAQTMTYGLFAARVQAPAGREFTRQEAAWNLPPTNPFLRKLFNEIAGPDLAKEIAWAVDDLAHLLARADMSEVLRDFGRATKREDPIVHFYETFLAHYNPQMRQRRGVYYTPEPVVSYIVRSIDHLLRTRFDRPMGLADEEVMILDPACGTGTFLYFVIQEIHDTVVGERGEGAWNSYVREKLLPRIFGFELLMAPYAIAHMKLALQLQELGYGFQYDERLGVYLTNTLVESLRRGAEGDMPLPFAGFIEEEVTAATRVKKINPIMVVLGNPPYSVSSANKGDYIERLMDRYKEAVRDERNIQPLSDDYIKFLRFAHDRIERTGYGIVGMITNHSYLSGLIHRGMREELLKSFDEIYLLNLHGNSMIGEKAPDGSPDENVFDIRQGVAIALLVKVADGQGGADVRYADVWGSRRGKYSYLLDGDASATQWRRLHPAGRQFFFIPMDLDLAGEYEAAWPLLGILRLHSDGVKTHRDRQVVDFETAGLRPRIEALIDPEVTDQDLRQLLGFTDTATWKLGAARKALQGDVEWRNRFCSYAYRPFDTRIVFFSRHMIDRPRLDVMPHMMGQNLALLSNRQVRTETVRHFWVTDTIVDFHLLETVHASMTVFPLYVYTDVREDEASVLGAGLSAREPNLYPGFITALATKLVLDFIPNGKGDLESTFGPEDIFHYMYAVFHSPTYRERYAEFLKIDFPRLPLTSDLGLFRGLAEKGKELVALHLMQSPTLDHPVAKFPIKGSNEVEKVRYAEPAEGRPGLVYINKTQYFQGVEPEVWEFHIGRYQVLEKWLKDRKARTLSYDDVTHYGRVVVALKETIRLMEEIDELIPSWPIE
jgi:predicted helicase